MTMDTDDQNLADWRREQAEMHGWSMPTAASVELSPEVRALLERLAPSEPINDDERGGCVWCDGRPVGEPYGYATSDPAHHTDSCAWLEARALLASSGE